MTLPAKEIIIKQPRGIFIDFETLPLQMLGWGLYKPTFNHKFVMQDKSIISMSYRTNDDPEIKTISIKDNKKRFLRDPYDDSEVVEKVIKLIEDFDYVVAHNGDRFDLPLIRSRAAVHGIPPIAPIKQIDTLKMAKKVFGQAFACNKLDYLCKVLGLGRKLEVGDSDWVAIVNRDIDAVHRMDEYGKQDIVLLYDLFEFLKPRVPAMINMNLINDTKLACPHCGGENIWKRGHFYTKVAQRDRYQCKDCGGWSCSTAKNKTAEVK